VEPDDNGPTATALREATEETGVEPGGVQVVAELPTLWLAHSRFFVVPVVAWWRQPCAVQPVDPGEVAAVARVPITALVDPANRFTVHHPSGRTGPAFDVGELFVWGFTAGVLDRLLDVAGWARPWNRADVRPFPPGRQ
jgi:8-oxo-dGTP pyrophosphatase MutT (NUDIX family)